MLHGLQGFIFFIAHGFAFMAQGLQGLAANADVTSHVRPAINVNIILVIFLIIVPPVKSGPDACRPIRYLSPPSPISYTLNATGPARGACDHDP